MKKHILALMIAVLSVFTVACGKATEESSDIDVKSVVQDEVGTGVETKITSGYVPGVYTETGYESEYLGFKYITPDGFFIVSQEEREEISEYSEDFLIENNYTQLQLKYEEMVTIEELMVSNELGVTNFNISLKKTFEDLEGYVKLYKKALPGFSTATVEVIGEEETELAGDIYTKISGKMEYQGYLLWTDIYLRKQDDRIVTVTVAWIDGFEAEKETMMSGFAAF